MNSYHDPDLEEILQDDELRRVASLLSSARLPEPPVDDAFRTGLRRQLMQQAWTMSEGRNPWWRRAFAPPGLAWAGAAVGLILIGTAVVWGALQQPGGFNQVFVQSPIDGQNAVALQQPILVSFNQPMNHQTTEAAVQIMPATNVTFAWAQDSRSMQVQPVAGNLAPNTQYQVTIGPGATTQSGQQLVAPQTITFVTQPPPTPAPSPSPRPTPANPLAEKQLVTINGPAHLVAQWSADSSSIYFIDGKGTLVVVSKTGAASVIAQEGTSSLSISPAGDRLAYVRAGKIEILTFATGKTEEVVATPAATLVAWARDRVVWAAAGGFYTQGAGGQSQVAALPASGAVAVVSIAPDGAHATYRQDDRLFVIEFANGKSTQLGPAKASFEGWSPDGAYLLYSTGDSVIVADPQGLTQATLPGGDASWSTQDTILLGGDTGLYQVRADGSGGTPVASGTYRSPMWAPDGATFAFVRGNNLWVGTAPPLPPAPTPVDEAGKVVSAFMDARLKGQAGEASSVLDASGKKAYGDGGLDLLVKGDPKFTRYYVVTQALIDTNPDTVRVVVRLVLTHGKLDVNSYEETLTLVRDLNTKVFLVDKATGGSHRDLGKGAEVVSVDVTKDGVKITFDSDLDPGTISDGVLILDSDGKQVTATATYVNRTVTLSGFDLKAGARYRLVVLTKVRDVLGHSVSAEYDLDLVGPAIKHARRDVVTSEPAPAPSPSPNS